MILLSIVKYSKRSHPIAPDFLSMVFQELQNTAKKATRQFNKDANQTINNVCSARGNLIFNDEYFLASQYLKPWTLNVDYSISLLTWHVATDILKCDAELYSMT